MSNIRESEVLHVDGLGNPIAISFDPGAFSEETLGTILNNQITSPKPLEIHCYVRHTFKTIEATEFTGMQNKSDEERKEFINEKLALLKGLDTFDIIFSQPLEPWKSPL